MPPRNPLQSVALRSLPALVALATALGTTACDNTQPSAALGVPELRKEIVTPPQVVKALERTTTLNKDVTRSAVIGKGGGSFGIEELGLSVSVPTGALDRDVTFTVTAKAGTIIAYEFGPAGSVFKLPLKVKQDLKYTTWYKVELPEAMEGAYFADDSQLDQKTGEATVNEFVKTTLTKSEDKKTKVTTYSKVEMDVNHFSGYIIATGRNSAY